MASSLSPPPSPPPRRTNLGASAITVTVQPPSPAKACRASGGTGRAAERWQRPMRAHARLLAGIVGITHAVDASIEPARMMAEWRRIREDALDTAFARHPDDPEGFVVEMHAYLRETRAIPSGGTGNGWDVFAALLAESEPGTGCVCICGTVFLLLACAEVGFFPARVIGLSASDHAFVSEPTLQRAFETTRACRSAWFPLVRECRAAGLVCPLDRFFPIDTADALLSHYATNIATLVVLHQGSAVLAGNLLADHPDPASPAWCLARWLHYMGRDKRNPATMLRLLQLALDALERRDAAGADLVAAFARPLAAVLDILRTTAEAWRASASGASTGDAPIPARYRRLLHALALRAQDDMAAVRAHNPYVSAAYDEARVALAGWPSPP